MNEPDWLDVSIMFDVHAEQLALFGGADGVRDRGLLESALARPINQFACGDTDLASLAAAYAFGIAKNHPLSMAAREPRLHRSWCFSGSMGSISPRCLNMSPP